MPAKWIVYNDLAWTDPIIQSPQDCQQDTEYYCQLIYRNSADRPKSLLHLGSGAGMYDYTFKQHFDVTSVDLSKGMLKIARELNPEVIYYQGDMRDIRLNKRFDAVIIPDSIGYMITKKDLAKTISNAGRHLKKGGCLLIVTPVKDTFKNNNFTYRGKDKNVEITIFENNHLTSRSRYEATMIYLIRQNKNLQIYSETHTLGIFKLSHWLKLLESKHFEVTMQAAADMYRSFIMNGGEYPQTVLIGKKMIS